MDICTLREFATDDVIIRILAKERGKLASKGCGTRDIVNGKDGRPDGELTVADLTPPHSLWIRIPSGRKPKNADLGIEKWTRRKKIDTARVYGTMVRYRKSDPGLPWVRNLEAFIREIRSIVDGSTAFRLESPAILPKYKKDGKRPDGTVVHIYRPICVYSDIRTKVVLALACKYMLAMFDRCFHSRMFFMRNARKDTEGNWSTPDYRDCVRMASAFRKAHEGDDIYVGECDIQKFYDIFNHDSILCCLDRLFELRASLAGTDTVVFRQLRRVMEMYLDSFDFPGHVLRLNDDAQFWAREVSSRTTADDPHPVCMFDWVQRENFLKCGCYGSGEELDRAIKEGRIGIPQGGSLSGIIVNVVMNVVDTDIVSPKDPGRFFARYCDDILLMHTDREKCAAYLESYRKALAEQRLVWHDFVDVGSSKKDGSRKIGSAFWNAKSKSVFLWGRGERNSSDWIAFVGYEMRYTGEIRIRKDKVTGEFKRISRTYHKVVNSHEDDKVALLERFGELPDKLKDYELVTHDRFTRSQGRRLDKYVRLKARKASRILHARIPDGIATYADTLGGH